MVSSQLLVKNVRFDNIQSTGEIKSVKFNLPRGRLARILGFNWRMRNLLASTVEYSVDVLRNIDATINPDPSDILFCWQTVANLFTTDGDAREQPTGLRNLPKPFRTTGVSIQVAASQNTVTDLFFNIYYDTDDMEKDEDIQYLEKTKQRHRARF